MQRRNRAAEQHSERWKGRAIRRTVVAIGATAWATGLAFTAARSAAADDPSPCTATAQRTVAPDSVRVGTSVTVTAVIDITCPDVPAPADVVLTIDRSASMIGQSLVAAKHAAGLFVDGVDLSQMRIAVVAFDDVATIEVPLSTWRNRLKGAIAGISVPAAAGTDVVRALSASGRALAAGRGAGGDRAAAIVLLSDGLNNRGAAPVLQQALLQRSNGVHISTIALGRRADLDLLRAIAATPADYWRAPSASDLAAIYLRIAGRLAHLAVRHIAVDDTVGATLQPVQGSAVPQAALQADHQRWTVPAAVSGPITLTYRLIPTTPGRWPISAATGASFEDRLGRRGEVEVPVPWLDVWIERPTATASHTASPSATPSPPATSVTQTSTASGTPAPSQTATAHASPTAGSTRIFLPIVAAAACVSAAAKLDVIVVLDTSTTMLGATGSGRRKLDVAIEGVAGFVDGLTSRGAVRVGVVRFDSTARVWVPLSGDLSAVRTALGVPITAAQGSRIDLGLLVAAEVLGPPVTGPTGHRAIVLVSDGQVFGATEDAVLAAADTVRAAHTVLYAVAVGPNAAAALLRRVAGSEARLFDAGDGDGIGRAFRAVGITLPCP